MAFARLSKKSFFYCQPLKETCSFAAEFRIFFILKDSAYFSLEGKLPGAKEYVETLTIEKRRKIKHKSMFATNEE